MSAAQLGQALSVLVAIAAALVSLRQIVLLRKHPALRRVLMVVGLWYFSVIYIMAALPEPSYLIKAGVMTRIGVLFLLGTLALDKGDC